ncbi:sulfatase family protein [Pontiella sulfatireligans]|uniref:Arylsulfatase n=1 Tax=Pontiella sulfatireligans TaxID=2750658 RepID=A0A6C2UEX0_9BACT|nr:arylsulfatase [Pontiella sulfatireligans]SPS74125.1 sulfatase S1_15 [Kiritimatiellales bacterium]VGO18077.1 Arylsulfatase [Pontiella sulfatireligans]
MKIHQIMSGLVLVATAVLGAQQPNIVYILADDMGPGDVSCYNADGKFKTPNIDRMAREGMQFMDAHTSSSVCTPTRYGIMTGRYSWRTWLKEGVLGGHSDPIIEQGRETVASLMKKDGYSTALIGKWHLGMSWENDAPAKAKRVTAKYVKNPKIPVKNGPTTLGFDYYFGLTSSLDHDPHAYMENDQLLGELFLTQGGKKSDEMKKLGFPTGRPGWVAKGFKNENVLKDLAAKTDEWITAHKEDPFFVCMTLTSPHNPICPRPEFQGKSGIGPHGDFCIETDWAVGEVLKTLDRLGLAENTIVIFTSDNGTNGGAGIGEMQKLGHYSSWIYRGAKRSIFEGGHRMPFVVRWPEGIKAGSVDKQLICTTDLIATLAELSGQKLADKAGEDSVSFLPAMKGEAIPGEKDRLIVHHDSLGFYAARKGKWKLIMDYTQGKGEGAMKKQEPIKDATPTLLFDMDKDPGETVNLIQQYPEMAEALKKELAMVISNGRSTPGPKGVNDAPWPGETWHQIDALKEYM